MGDGVLWEIFINNSINKERKESKINFK